MPVAALAGIPVGRRAVVKGGLGLMGLGLLGTRRAPVIGGRAPDYVVVGGGIYGIGIAWELGRRGARVLVLEARRLASGASGGVGRRGVRSNGRDGRQLPLMKIAQQRWVELAHALGDRRVFTRTGELHLIESDADLAAAEAQVQLQEAHGVSTRLVDRTELRRLEPDLGAQVIAAMYCPDDGVSDHSVTTRALARRASRHGARIRRGIQVVGVELDGGRASAVVSARGERIAIGGELVLAANAGTADIVGSALGLHLPLFNVLPQVLVTEAVHDVRVRHLIGHTTRRLNMKRLPGGRLMITGGWLGRVDPATGRGETDPSQVTGNLAEAVAVYPALAGVRVRRALADRFESIAPDLLPIIDRPPGISNVLVVAGSSGQGWAPAPAYVQLIAEWLLSGVRPELLAPFGLARFGT